jgi:hypothetical protein
MHQEYVLIAEGDFSIHPIVVNVIYGIVTHFAEGKQIPGIIAVDNMDGKTVFYNALKCAGGYNVPAVNNGGSAFRFCFSYSSI